METNSIVVRWIDLSVEHGLRDRRVTLKQLNDALELSDDPETDEEFEAGELGDLATQAKAATTDQELTVVTLEASTEYLTHLTPKSWKPTSSKNS